MKCPECGADLKEGVLFCRECGAQVETSPKKCSECGAVLEEGAVFCVECGSKVEESSYSERNTSPEANTSKRISYDRQRGAEQTRRMHTAAARERHIRTHEKSNKTLTSARSGRAVHKKGKKNLFIMAALAIILIGAIATRGLKGSLPNSNKASESKIAVINVVDMSYSDAVQALQAAGFTNISSNVSPNADGTQWVVTKQSVAAEKTIRSDERIELTCAGRCKLYIDVRSEANLMFSTYDIAIFLDGKEIGTIPNGKSFSVLTSTFTGEHTLEFCKSGSASPKSTKKISISGDMTYSCVLGHSGNSIDIKNEKTDGNIVGAALEVPDVTGKVLSEAFNILSSIGFSNLREEPNGSIWDRNNWLVTAQNLSAGTVTDKNTFIQLDCIRLDDYFSNTYVGKNINEIQGLAATSGFALSFIDESWSDMNSEVAAMDQQTKNDWVATRARQYSGAQKTAVVTIKYTGVLITPTEIAAPTPEPMAQPTPTATPKSAVDFSTNDKDTVKNGNSGVYAYKSHGGTYDNYWVIDFDAGNVYNFQKGNGNSLCDRVKIDSGDLNSVVIITYHDGSDKWQYGLHFKWARQPEHLILQDNDGFEYDFYATNLDDALRLRDKMTIHDY